MIGSPVTPSYDIPKDDLLVCIRMLRTEQFMTEKPEKFNDRFYGL